jgi:hypothetical protein
LASFGKRVDRPADRRWLKRKRVGISAFAIGADGTKSVLIQDLSMAGARLLGRDLAAPGAMVELKVGERSLLGQIAWATGDRCGVSLDFGRR